MQDPSDETRPDRLEPTEPSPSEAETVEDSNWPRGAVAGRGSLPETIGKYRILGLIGEGGMGSVFEAEQDAPRRRVALKVIKAGVASRSMLHRFEVEAQVLGKLDHPGIATIYEAGTFGEGEGAQPYFAMEFVEGRLLTEYARSKNLGTRERLALLAKIADAVQHAHQKGVIHRDLKPANILVTGAGVVKILDFGVARVTDADIQTATMQTDIGQLVGTIPYMSPEQASGNPEDLDTRSDVYALGVIAYELLTGQMPYDLRQKMIHEAVRVIREDEPRALSSINRTFRGDVEIIVGKALTKEKERRYQSASDLAGDIERYLNNEPIEARPPSTWYQLSKFSKRNKALVSGAAAVLVVSVVGALISVNFALGEAEQRRAAEEAAEEARVAQIAAETARAEEVRRADELEQVAGYQFDQLRGFDPDAMGSSIRRGIRERIDAVSRRRRLEPAEAERLLEEYDTQVAGADFTGLALAVLDEHIFEPSLLAIGERFADQPLVEARLLSSLGKTMQDAGLIDRAALPLQRAYEIHRDRLGEDDPRTLASVQFLGELARDRGDLPRAAELLRESLEGFRRVRGADDEGALTAQNNLGRVLMSMSRLDEAEHELRDSLDRVRRLRGDEHPDTLAAMSNLAALLRGRGEFAQSEAIYLEALETLTLVESEDHPTTLAVMNNLGELLILTGRVDEAEAYRGRVLEISRRTFGDEHPNTLVAINSMASVYSRRGAFGQAESLYREVLEGRRRTLGDGHPKTYAAAHDLGLALYRQGRYSEAEPLLREALDGETRTLGRAHPDTVASMGNLGALLFGLGKLEEAGALFEESLEIHRVVLGDDHPDTLLAITNLSVLMNAVGRDEDSERLAREALATRRRVLGDSHPDTLESMEDVAYVLDAAGRFGESEELRRLRLELARSADPRDDVKLGSALVQLGMNLLEQGRFGEAEPILRECLDVRRLALGEGDWLIWQTQSLLGESLLEQGSFRDAEALVVEAAERIEPPPAWSVRKAEALGRVVRLYAAWHEIEPDAGYDERSRAYQARVDSLGGVDSSETD